MPILDSSLPKICSKMMVTYVEEKERERERTPKKKGGCGGGKSSKANLHLTPPPSPPFPPQTHPSFLFSALIY